MTQYLVYYRLFLPAFRTENLSAQLGGTPFFTLVFITLLLTACGNVINDILDQEIDRVNKPQRQVVGIQISTQGANWIFAFFGFLGFMLSVALALYADRVQLLWIYPVALIGLYYYSLRLKRWPLVGNIVVAGFCAGVAGIVWVAEYDSLIHLPEKPLQATQIILTWYMAFAFLATLYRELIKDMEDMEGDQEIGCRTLPIVLGLQNARWAVLFLNILLLGLILIFFFFLSHFFHPATIYYIIAALCAPLLVCGYILLFRFKPSVFGALSLLAKGIILMGVLLLLFVQISGS
jgi:4-hydroxybenzoate polyprenyltransferase